MTQAWGPGGRVLVIGGATSVTAVLRALDAGGFESTAAATGQAGVAAVQGAQPGAYAGAVACVLLVDDLPDMTPAQVLAALGGGSSGLTPCPVLVLCTAPGAASHRDELRRAGAQECIGTEWLDAPALRRAVEAAIDRWALLRSLRASEAAQRHGAALDAFRLALDAATHTLAEPAAVQAQAASVLGRQLRASRVFYVEFGQGDEFIVDQAYADGVPHIAGRFRLDRYGPGLRRELAAGREVVDADVAHAAHYSAADRARYAAAQVGAQVIVPLRKQEQLRAMLVVQQNQPRAWTAHDVALVAVTAQRTWSETQRARAESELRAHAQILQHTLARERASRAQADALAALRRHEAVAAATANPGRTWWQPMLAARLEYVVGLSAVALTLLLRWLLDDMLGDASPILLTWLALVPAAFFLRTAPFAAAAAFALVASDLLFIEPRGQLGVFLTPAALIQGAVFTLVAAGLALLARRARGGEASALAEAAAARAAAAALLESEQRFARALEAARAGVWTLDPGAKAFTASDGALALHGLPPGTVLDHDAALACVHAQDRAQVDVALCSAIEHGQPFRIEYRTVWPDGSQHWLLSIAELQSKAGTPRLVGLVQDITDIHAAVSEVRQSQARLSELISLMPSFTAVLRGPRHVFELANKPYHSLLGRGPEILGKAVLDAVPEIADQPFPAFLDQVYRTGQPFQAKGMRLLLARGPGEGLDEVFVDFAYVPLRELDGAVSGILVHGMDRTEQVRAEHSLRRREVELRTLADNTPEVLTRFDRQLRHVFVNKAVEAVTGLRCQDFLGRTNKELGMPAALCALWDDALRSVFDQRAPRSIEFAFQSPTGLRHFESRLVPEFAADSSVEFALGVTLDVTERKRFELTLAEQDRRKDEFLATLSHELRNPLSPLRNGVAILRRVSTPEQIERTLAMMERQLHHLVHLVDDLLDVSRVSMGKINLRLEPLTVAELVDAALEACRPAIASRGHTVQMALPDTPLHVDGDRTRLVQVIANLLTNASKYSEPGGRIDIAAMAQGHECAIRVSDTGVGLAPEVIDKLGDMFMQVRDTLDKAQGGLGIGLSLAKKLVALHGGSLAAASPGLGLGSTFTITLPLAAQAASPLSRRADVADTPKPGSLHRKVLVADDNADSADSLAEVLRLDGHTVATAYEGRAAIDLARSLRPEVVFLDIGLPGIDGHEVARRLRADSQTAHATLVAVTGWGTEEDKRKSRRAGFDWHLTKPVRFSDVEELLRQPVAQPADSRVYLHASHSGLGPSGGRAGS